jgi:hypothetical protein
MYQFVKYYLGFKISKKVVVLIFIRTIDFKKQFKNNFLFTYLMRREYFFKNQCFQIDYAKKVNL